MLSALAVIAGAALWATDTLFRHPMIQQVSPLTVVLIEHVFATALAIIPVLLLRQNPIKLRSQQWSSLFLIGMLGSCLATVFFTASFQFVNPTVAILLQKVQPLLVVTLSYIFLKERPTRAFWPWATLAVVAAFWMSFPDGVSSSDLEFKTESGSLRGTFFALGAAAIWAVTTVVGKHTLREVKSETVTFWRFFFGLLGALLLVKMSPQVQLEIPFVRADSSVLRSIFAMALISGFLGVGLYYRGLSRVSASVATVLELAFPLTAMWVNATFLDLHLKPVQVGAAIVLMISMVGVSRQITR